MAEKTEYVILRAITTPTRPEEAAPIEQTTAWLECGTAEGHGDRQAITAFLEADTKLPEGEHELIAVPSRSWRNPEPVEVTTKRTAALKRPTKVATHA